MGSHYTDNRSISSIWSYINSGFTMMSYQHRIVFLLGILLSPRESQGCWPSTPTRTQPECSGQPCGVVCNMTVSGVCDGKGFCVSPLENPCVQHGCGGKQCGEECIQGDIIGTCDSDGDCRLDGGNISCPGSEGSV